MASLQLYGGLNVPQRFITGLQADTREQSQASSAWCIFNPFVPACVGERKRAVEREKGKAAPSNHSALAISLTVSGSYKDGRVESTAISQSPNIPPLTPSLDPMTVRKNKKGDQGEG